MQLPISKTVWLSTVKLSFFSFVSDLIIFLQKYEIPHSGISFMSSPSQEGCSDFIHQILKVPIPLKLGKTLMPKAGARASKTRGGGGESTRGG